MMSKKSPKKIPNNPQHTDNIHEFEPCPHCGGTVEKIKVVGATCRACGRNVPPIPSLDDQTALSRQDYLLACLAEECGETAQRASKAMRFGLQETQQGRAETNATRIIREFNDIVAVMELLFDTSYRNIIDLNMVGPKRAQLASWMEYSRKHGRLNGGKHG